MTSKLIFVSENCDEVMFDWEDVVDFQLDGADVSLIKTMGFDAPLEFAGFRYMFAEISKKADVEHLCFGALPSDLTEFGWMVRADITQVIVEQDFGEHTYYLREDQEVRVKILNGNLVIEIH